MRNQIPIAVLEFILDQGYRVLMRQPSDSYCFYSDGTHIGYVQYDAMAGFSVSTVHVPNRYSGTGYQITRHAGELTASMLERALVAAQPSWDRSSPAPRQYADLEAWRNESSWNRGFIEVDATVSS